MLSRFIINLPQSLTIVFNIVIMDMCIECNIIVTGRQHALECDYCNQWQHCICGTGLTLTEYRASVRNGGLDWGVWPVFSSRK